MERVVNFHRYQTGIYPDPSEALFAAQARSVTERSIACRPGLTSIRATAVYRGEFYAS